ncbi:MAG: hypothetical protein VX874_11770 [Pseudomonadota bacterium]|nr:hypothetical protein [Pseudomonadota bacterium]
MTADPTTRDDLSEQAVRSLGRSIEEGFERAGRTMFSLIGALRDQKSRLERIAEAFRPDRRDWLRDTSQSLAKRMQARAARLGALGDAVRALEVERDNLDRQLDGQKKENRMAVMVATNARVVSRTIAKDGNAIEVFAQDVSRIIDASADHTETLQAALETAETLLADVARRTRGAAAQSQVVRQLADWLAGQLDALAQSDRVRHTAVAVTSHVSALSADLNTLVASLQAGDAARQRLEHVVAILERAATQRAPVRRQLSDLALHQAIGTLDDLVSALDSSLALMAQLEDAWEQAAIRSGELGDSTTGFELGLMHTKAHELDQAVGATLSGHAKLTTLLQQLAGHYDRVSDVAGSISTLEARMGLMSTNVILTSRRLGRDGFAMMEVARQLQDCTSNIGERSVSIAALSQRQAQTAAQAVDFGAGEDDSAQGDPALSDALAELSALGDDITRVVALASSSEAPSEARRVAETFTTLRRRCTDVRAALRPSTDRIPEVTEALADLLREVEVIYTTPAERAIHAAFLGRADDDAPTEDADQDSLLDALF